MSLLVFGVYWDPEEVGLTPVKSCLGSRTELASEREGKRAKEPKLPSSVSFIQAAERRCDSDVEQVF